MVTRTSSFRVLFVAEGREAETVKAFAANLRAHRGQPSAIKAISIDMSPAFIKGTAEHFPTAQITFDKFHVIAHASAAIDAMRRLEQKCEAARSSPPPSAPSSMRCWCA